MASYTTNLDLKKPAQSDKIRIADINGNMDDIDAAFGAIGDTSVATQVSDIRAGMAIVSVSNTHDAIASGEYVYVTGHDTLDDGLYVATAAIAANGTLSSSNLTAVSKGGLNALNDQIASLKTFAQIYNDDIIAGNSKTYTLTTATQVAMIFINNGNGAVAVWAISFRSASEIGKERLSTAEASSTVTTSGMTFTVACTYSAKVKVVVF